MFPEPGLLQLPPLATHVQVALVRAGGSTSTTAAPIASPGPAFETTIVYVTVCPGTTVAAPSVLVMARSASPLGALLSDPDAGLPAGSVAVAVLISGLLVKFAANATGAVNV